MPFRFLKKIEIFERTLPLIFFVFAAVMATTDVFDAQTYQFTAVRTENFWLPLFIAAGLLQFAATELNAPDRQAAAVWYQPFARVKRKFSDLAKFRFRVAMIGISFVIWCPWAVGLLFQLGAHFGTVMWAAMAYMTFRTFVRVLNEPIKYEK